MINRDVAAVFDEIADLLELKGDNPFRIRAYRRAAQNIEVFPSDVGAMAVDALVKIPGIGRDLAAKIREYAETGAIATWSELKAEFPEGILDLMSVPGLGPKTAKLLFDELGISGIDDLEARARKGELRGLPHIGEKTEENILKGIAVLRRGRERAPIGRARPLAEQIVQWLRDNAPVKDISVAGSIRRWRETAKDIDILAVSDEAPKVMSAFAAMPWVGSVIAKGNTKSSVVLSQGIQVDVRVVEESVYGAALLYFTGSKAHNIKIREIAVRKGMKISEYGIFDEATGKSLGGRREEDIYRVLGMDYIEPELREDMGEVEAALNHTLPDLVKPGDILGDLHVHSDWTDGQHSIDQIVAAAKMRNYRYVAITDHSKGLGIAGGLSAERLIEQGRQIEALNRKLRGFRVLKGVEVDIRSDGRLDLPDEVLSRLDIVIAAVHSGFKQAGTQLTRRIVAAMRNRNVSIIAHPTGRLIGEREPYEIDMGKLLDEAHSTGTALEINAFPDRLDLNDSYAREARRLGVRAVISTDAHSQAHLDFMRFGIAVARRGWLEKKDVVNTLPLRDLRRFLARKKGQ